MTVKEIIEHILFRTGRKLMEDHGPQFIIDVMNKQYNWANTEFLLLEESEDYTFTTYDADGVDYKNLPARCISGGVFRITPFMVFRPKNVYSSSEANTYTLYNRKLYFSNVTSSTEITINFYSQGKTLVDKTDAEITAGDTGEEEANTPQWAQTNWHWFLVHSVARELAPNNPFRKTDDEEQAKFISLFQSHRALAVRSYPNLTGPQERRSYLVTDQTTRDPYE